MIFVRLRPCASANRIDGIQKLPDGSVCHVVRVTAAPEKGRANQALVKLLAKAWRVSQSSLSIVAGAKERTKILLFERGCRSRNVDAAKVAGRRDGLIR